MAKELKIGSVVITKAGSSQSPKMIVVGMKETDVLCKWFNTATQKFESESFPIDALEILIP